MLEVTGLRVCYGDVCVVRDVSFTARENDWLMIVGPNGAGKSTILAAIAQSAPYTGEVRVCGLDLRRMKSAARARAVGVLTQNHTVSFGFSVQELVELGRYAYSRGRLDQEDRRMVNEALARTGLLERRRQSLFTLSGGELQRSFLAQVFAQDPQVLLLDEPMNHLDLAYQRQLFALIADWAGQPGRAVISVMHDLSVAKRYGTAALLLHEGRIIAEGTRGEAFNPESLQAVYGMDLYAWMRELSSVWGRRGEELEDDR